MISIAIPIYNEEKYLPYFINSLKPCLDFVDEIVFSIDHGTTDRSEEIIRKHLPQAKIVFKDKPKWNNAVAENHEYAISHTRGDIVFDLGADLWLDPRMFHYAKKFLKKYDAVSFRYYNWTLNASLIWRIREIYDNILKKVLDIISPYKESYHSGIFAFRREAWERTHLRDIPSEYDDFLKRLGAKRHLHIRDTNILHLRAGFSKGRQLMQGMSRCQLNYPLWKVIAHCFLHLKPYVLIGYLQEKSRRMFQSKVWRKDN